MKLLRILSDLLFPEKCVLCGRILEKDEMDLCHRCRVEAPEYTGHTKYPYLETLTAVWYYENEVRKSILGYKFGGRRNYADCYGRLLAMALDKKGLAEFDMLTWIPISQKRLKKRGFDQVQLLAQKLGRELKVEPVAALRKLHDNPPQSHITGRAQRRANVLGVYEVLDPGALAGKRILLLDDIITTGATAGECARVLLTAGAKEVHCAVIAAARQHQ